MIEWNKKTRYYDWYVKLPLGRGGCLSGRCLTKEKAIQHESIACNALIVQPALTITEFHDMKQVLLDVFNSPAHTQRIIHVLTGRGQ